MWNFCICRQFTLRGQQTLSHPSASCDPQSCAARSFPNCSWNVQTSSPPPRDWRSSCHALIWTFQIPCADDQRPAQSRKTRERGLTEATFCLPFPISTMRVSDIINLYYTLKIRLSINDKEAVLSVLLAQSNRSS